MVRNFLLALSLLFCSMTTLPMIASTNSSTPLTLINALGNLTYSTQARMMNPVPLLVSQPATPPLPLKQSPLYFGGPNYISNAVTYGENCNSVLAQGHFGLWLSNPQSTLAITYPIDEAQVYILCSTASTSNNEAAHKPTPKQKHPKQIKPALTRSQNVTFSMMNITKSLSVKYSSKPSEVNKTFSLRLTPANIEAPSINQPLYFKNSLLGINSISKINVFGKNCISGSDQMTLYITNNQLPTLAAIIGTSPMSPEQGYFAELYIVCFTQNNITSTNHNGNTPPLHNNTNKPSSLTMINVARDLKATAFNDNGTYPLTNINQSIEIPYQNGEMPPIFIGTALTKETFPKNEFHTSKVKIFGNNCQHKYSEDNQDYGLSVIDTNTPTLAVIYGASPASGGNEYVYVACYTQQQSSRQ